MSGPTPDNPADGHTASHAASGGIIRGRDWIAVDQSLRRLLDAATDPRERSALLAAAASVGGPDPRILGGGPEWQAALDAARATQPPPTLPAAPGQPDIEHLIPGHDPALAAAVHSLLIQDRHLIADWLDTTGHHELADHLRATTT